MLGFDYLCSIYFDVTIACNESIRMIVAFMHAVRRGNEQYLLLYRCGQPVSAVVDAPKNSRRANADRERFGTTAQVGTPKHSFGEIRQAYAKVVVKDRTGLLSRY